MAELEQNQALSRLPYTTKCSVMVNIYTLKQAGDSGQYGAVHYSKMASLKPSMSEWDKKFSRQLIVDSERLQNFAQTGKYDAVLAVPSGRRYASALSAAVASIGMIDLSDRVTKLKQLESGIDNTDAEAVRQNFRYLPQGDEGQWMRVLIVDDVVNTGASIDGVVKSISNHLSVGVEIDVLCFHATNPSEVAREIGGNT
jgi:adenine/guanine phosphoribosyltransferase-like PRPP-binding protein